MIELSGPITFFITSFLKLGCMLPFFFYYMLSRRMLKVLNDKTIKKPLKLGFIFTVISILITLALNSLSLFVNLNDMTFNIVYVGQILSNISLIISYSLLLKGIYLLKKFRCDPLGHIILFVFVLSIMDALFVNDVLLIITLITYQTAIYILSVCFYAMSRFFKKINPSLSIFVLLSSFLIMVDPVIYSFFYAKIFSTLTEEVMNSFIYYRMVAYVANIFAIILAMIPQFTFIIRLFISKKIMPENDKEMNLLIKDYVNSVDIILGKTAYYIFKKTLKSMNKTYSEFSKGMIKDGEARQLFSLLIDQYYIILGDAAHVVLTKLRNDKNSKLIDSFYPEKKFLNHSK